MPRKGYMNEVTWCCFLVNCFIAHKVLAAIRVKLHDTGCKLYPPKVNTT
jgi:hypothetical protein